MASSGWVIVKAGAFACKLFQRRGKTGIGIYLEYSTLLPRNFLDSFTENMYMVNAEGSDTSDNRIRDNICAIVCPSNTYFKNCGINLFIQENMQCHESDESEVSWHVRRSNDLSLDMMLEVNSTMSVGEATHCVIGNEFIPDFEKIFSEFILRKWCAIDSNPFTNSHHMWGGIETYHENSC